MTIKVFRIAIKLFRWMSNKQNTLVILTPGFAGSEADSTCLPMQQQFIKTLKKVYPHLNIVILSFQYPYHQQCYQWFEASVIPFNGRNKGGLSRLLLRQKVYASLKKINSSNNIIGLLSFWCAECALVGKRFADKNGLKHYCWILGQDARKENKYPQRVFSKGEELIALSDFLQEQFEKSHGIKPLIVIPPGIDVMPISLEKDIDLLAAGSLIPLKNYHVFIEAVAEIRKIKSTVKAILIGEGPEKKELQALIAKLGLEENVSLTGELPHDEVLQLMQRSKLFLHPSSYEGFSGVCLEALSCGAHVISFCKAMNQQIEQWHIVKTKEEMQDKAIKILSNNNISYKSIVPFAMENTVKKMMKLYCKQTSIS